MNLDIGEVVVHVVAETRLTVLLLFGCYVAVVHLFHQHDLLLVRRKQHHHACCIVAAGKGVLTEECQWAQVGHVGVEQHKGNLLGMHDVSVFAGDVQL